MRNKKPLDELLSKAQAGDKFLCQSPDGVAYYSYELLQRNSFTITEITGEWGYDIPRVNSRTVYIIASETGELRATVYESLEEAEKHLLPSDLGVRVFIESLGE